VLLYEPLTVTTYEPKHIVKIYSTVYNEKCCAYYMACCVYLDSITQLKYTEQSMADTVRLFSLNASAYQKYAQRT
jgi:hypothetical protein